MRPVTRLRGMEDLSHEAWRRKRALQDCLIDLLGSRGYNCLETPILEPTELFMRKSGGQLASRLYSFTDPGSNAVSLRPEFTSSIMRYHLENAPATDLPARWQYTGPVFRFGEDGEINGQFTQVGGELIGAGSIIADVELLSLAASVPSSIGLQGWHLELADLDVLNSVLDPVGVSDRARNFIIESIPQIRTGPKAVSEVLQQAEKLLLTNHDEHDAYLSQAIQGLDDNQARMVLHGLLQWAAADQLGQREPDEVVERLLRKLRGSDDRASLKRGLELIGELAGIRGEPGDAIERARKIMMRAGASQNALDRMAELAGLVLALPEMGEHLVVDFGLAPGLAYYNGIVFEVTHPSSPNSIGGGGRYDGLARALGSKDPVPALGFAYNLDALLSLSNWTNGFRGDHSGDKDRDRYLVVSETPGSYDHALRVTGEVRREGKLAEMDVAGMDLAAARSYARRRGIKNLITVDQAGRRTTHALE